VATEPTRQAGHSSKQQQDEQTGQAIILDVVVEEPGSTCNIYQQDREHGALRMEGILAVETPRPADLARFPLESQRRALDIIGDSARRAHSRVSSEAPSLPVLLLSIIAVAPKAWVSGRLVGAIRTTAARNTASSQILQGWKLLAIPLADASQEQIQTASQLAPERRAALAAFVVSQEQGNRHEGVGSAPADDLVQWLEAPEAARFVRQAKAIWRQNQRQQETQGGSAWGPREHLRIGKHPPQEEEQRVAWKALTGVSLQQLREQGLGAYAEAEHLLRLVPQRFQQYLGELLLDDERVLYFIERPRLRVSKGLLGLGVRYLNEGLLLCTDRQILWLRDVAAPDATLVPWGYAARSCPLERLADVQIVQAGQASEKLALASAPWVRLVIHSAASQGIAALVIEFPQNALPALQQAAALLQGFLPFPTRSLQAVSDRRVRRMPTVSAWQPGAEERDLLLQLGGMTPVEARERLQAALAKALHPGEEVLAQAIAPALSDYPGGPRLLALTRERLLFGQLEEARQRRQGKPESPVTITAVPLKQVAAVQLRHSLLGCTFEVVTPEPDGRTTQQFIPFNSPAIVPFRAIYTRTRLLLAGPYVGVQQPDRRVQSARAQEEAAV
jgi:hypothetical protein